MNIPENAVHIAARAIADATDAHRGFIGTVEAARIALEAAAQPVAAQAWEQGAKAQADAYGMYVDAGRNPYTGTP